MFTQTDPPGGYTEPLAESDMFALSLVVVACCMEGRSWEQCLCVACMCQSGPSVCACVVAYCMEGRSREQCAKRWEQLYPTNITRGRWTQHEDAVRVHAIDYLTSSIILRVPSYKRHEIGITLVLIIHQLQY